MSKLEMQQCVLGQVFTNCYFLKNKKTGELLIVDPGDYAEKVFQKVALMQGKPVGILLTHGHFDHIMAVKEVKEKYQIPVYACRQEEAMLAEPTVNMTAVYGRYCSLIYLAISVFFIPDSSIPMAIFTGRIPVRLPQGRVFPVALESI